MLRTDRKDEQVVLDVNNEGTQDFLQKPFYLSMLSEKLNKVLDEIIE